MTVKILKVVAPFLILMAGAYGAWRMIESRPDAPKQPAPRVLPAVRTMELEPVSMQLKVTSQGTVTPRTETRLVPEVAGRLVYVSPAFAAGGFFEEDEVLLRIDRTDYELAVVRAEAEVAQAKVRLEQEKAEAEVARREWEELGQGEPSALVLRIPQLQQTEASLEAARAALAQARRDLEKTEIRAPFAGRVRSENVDIGQFVARGQALAELYAVDVAEVRLPLPDEDLAYVDIPLSYRGGERRASGPDVLIKTSFAGREVSWKGEIVRTEGEIDTQTRMLYVVAQVEDPYSYRPGPERPPLAVGMFVQAEILGRWVDGVFVLPRSAIRGEQTVYLVDSENRLRFREVEILKRTEGQVLVNGGLSAGERVCVSPLETVVDGMEVRLLNQEGAP